MRNGLVTLVLIVGTAALLYLFLFNEEPSQSIPYSGSEDAFLTAVTDGEVESVLLRGENLEITLKEKDDEGNNLVLESFVPAQFTTSVQADINAACAAGPDCETVEFRGEPAEDGNAFLGLLVSMLFPILLIGVFLLFMMRQAQGSNNQAMSFGKSRARMFLGNKTVITFADVAGVDEAKQELQEVVEFLKYPEKFAALGARIPQGVLLVGPPGTGKTLLARAVAGEAGVPFFSISGSEFVEMFVGVGASRVRDLFDQAKRNSPCIVFVDEIDAVGRQRGAGLGGSHDEREQTLNQILVEMDGFDTNTNVIVIAATNRPDILDPALLRPGRFDRQVVLDRPDINGRLSHPRGPRQGQAARQGRSTWRPWPSRRPASPARTWPTSSTRPPSWPLAATRSRSACRSSRRRSTGSIAGPERKSRIISDEEKLITAYHEAGHAVVRASCRTADPVHKVSIIARGMMGRLHRDLPTEDRYLYSKSAVRGHPRRLLAGHVGRGDGLRRDHDRRRRTTSSGRPTSRARWSPSSA